MPFPKGVSGNPSGRKKTVGLSRPVRASQGLETWVRLLRMRDELVVERKQVGVTAEGEPITADVVLDAALYFRVLEKILAYCWGLPAQKVDFDSESGKAFAFAVMVNPEAEGLIDPNQCRDSVRAWRYPPAHRGSRQTVAFTVCALGVF
jgi:hypothetical protein